MKTVSLFILFAVNFFELGVPGEIIVSVAGSEQCNPRTKSRQQFESAVNYLQRSPLARRLLTHLKKSPNQYNVEIADPSISGDDLKPAEFDGTKNLIRWDPRAGLEWKANVFTRDSHSAAIVLFHELAHAFHKDTNPGQYRRRCKTRTGDEWGNLEEKLTILNLENPVARALGESERNFHEDAGVLEAQNFETTSPTSRRPADVKRPLFEYLF